MKGFILQRASLLIRSPSHAPQSKRFGILWWWDFKTMDKNYHFGNSQNSRYCVMTWCIWPSEIKCWQGIVSHNQARSGQVMWDLVNSGLKALNQIKGQVQVQPKHQGQSRSSADPESGSVQCPYLRLPNMGTIVRNKTYAVCVAVLGRELMITKKQLMSRLLLKFGDFKKMIKK